MKCAWRSAWAAVLLAIVFAPATVLAEGAAENVCFDAAVVGQKARKSGDLHAARAEFLRCAQAACPAEVTERCTGWVAEVDAAMPTVLVAPQDDRGHDLSQGVVRVDGEEHHEALEGKPIALEPGTHIVRYELAGRLPVEQSIVVREYEKNRRVTLRLAMTPKTPVAPFVLAGFGVASALAFGAFASVGAVDRQSSHCDATCPSASYNRVNAEFIGADVALGAAALFVTLAVIDYLVDGRSHAQPRASLPFVVRF